MNMPLVLLNRRRRGGSSSPLALFALGEQGAWYDPSDLTTLFTDTAGTTPATVGSAVALMRDKSGRANHATQASLAQRPILRQTGGGLYYLECDGSDDGMVTPTITPGTDKVQVFAGVRKLSDASFQVIAEMSVAINTNAGSMLLSVEGSSRASFLSRGSASLVQVNSTAATAPITFAHTGLGDISGDVTTVRVNGVLGATSSTDQGTGNYLAYPLYLFRRAGAASPFNGHFFGGIIRFGPNLTTAEITNTERFIAQKTGVVI